MGEALEFQQDDTIQQGLPLALTRTAWGGVDLENISGRPVVLRKLRVEQLDRTRHSSFCMSTHSDRGCDQSP